MPDDAQLQATEVAAETVAPVEKYDARDLLIELCQMQMTRKMDVGCATGSRVSNDRRKVFIAACANGYHESYESHEHALFLLVDSFRTRPEDTEAVYLPIMKWQGGTIEDARRTAAEMAKQGDVAKMLDAAMVAQLAVNADADQKRSDAQAASKVKTPPVGK